VVTPVSSTNKTDCHDITEILLQVVLNTMDTFLSFFLLLSDVKPYWWDIETEYEIYEALSANVTSAITENSQTWLTPVDLENEDPVARFTKNVTTEVRLYNKC
jgi:hypothetical protein